jgi:hypothetical protein
MCSHLVCCVFGEVKPAFDASEICREFDRKKMLGGEHSKNFEAVRTEDKERLTTIPATWPG